MSPFTGLMTRRAAACGCFVALCAGLALVPVQTKQGVDYQVTSYRVPLYEKVFGFIVRDAEYRRLVRQIIHGVSGEEARAGALFEWTRAHIRFTPPGWPLMDDHTLYIIFRGYGEADQMADVFVTLATYAGLSAFWKLVQAREGAGKLVLSFVRIHGRWTVWDVRHGVVFRTARGDLASVEDLASHPAWIRLAGAPALDGEQPYAQYIQHAVAPFVVPEVLRAEHQMPIPRMVFELTCLWKRLCRHACT